MKDCFTKNDTLAIKGIAILMMMWHHSFLSGRFKGYVISFWPFTQGQVTNIATYLKICVSIFAFLTGYGLVRSLQSALSGREKLSGRETTRWILVRYVKTFSSFWFIVLFVWIVTACIDRMPQKIYFSDSGFLGVFYMLIDFLGLGQLFDTPMMISTWWYMTAAFVFILSAPLLYSLMNRFGCLFMLAALFILPRIGGFEYPGGWDFFSFLPAYCIGMIFAKDELFGKMETWAKRKSIHRLIAVISSALATVLAYKLSLHLPTKQFWDVKFGLLAVIPIVFFFFTFVRIPVIKQVLRFFGRHSANIFWIHSFLRITYLRDFLYNLGHFLITLAVLFGLSLLLSILIEALKKLLRYDRLVARVIRSIGGASTPSA